MEKISQWAWSLGQSVVYIPAAGFWRLASQLSLTLQMVTFNWSLRVPLALVWDAVVRSVQVGSLYALMALGMTLTMAVVRFPNFAHAELITIGAYAGLLTSFIFPENIPLILMSAFVCAAVGGLVSHRLVYRPLSKARVSIYSMILASFAVGLIARYIIFLFVDRFDFFDKSAQVSQEVWLRTSDVILTNTFFWSVPTAFLLMGACSLLLGRTELGRQMRALADNPTMARIIGIPVDRVHDLTWLLAGGLAGVGGALWGIYTAVNPLTGWTSILSVFAATVLGGMTSFAGTILGAFVVSLSENLLMQWLNLQFGLDFNFKPAVPFIIIIGVLLFRPQGLTGLGDDFRQWWERR
jgi:branched-subunit amino acid ABC-type transport system permease component